MPASSKLAHTHTRRNKMKEISAYQIRLELLKLSKEILSENWYNKREVVIRDYENELRYVDDQNSKSLGKVIKYPAFPSMGSYPSEEDIIEKAIRMNDFVSNGK